MPAPSPPSRNDLVGTLRLAGCVFAEDEARLLSEAATSPAHLQALVARRTAGDPLETILGWAEFCGLRISVDPGVFVPRRRSELLVREALAVAPAHRAVVLDLCCGSGALGVAVAAALGPVELVAADIDAAAVRCAARNLRPLGGVVHRGDLYESVPAKLRGRVDLLLANTPYVPTAAIAGMPPEARLHEPLLALDGGADGLDLHRRAVAGAGDWLAPGGSLLIETSDDQADRTLALMAAASLSTRLAVDDDLDATVAIGTLPAVDS
jgi:release factor glutamine methyltransferase